MSLVESKNLSKIIRCSEFSVTLKLCFEIVGSDYSESKERLIYQTIKSNFENISLQDVLTAIKNGSSGMYGKTYKLTAQEVCIWVRNYLKNRPETKEEAHARRTLLASKF